MRPLLYGALLLLFVVRNDLWWWDTDQTLLGLPIGLTWHILLCLGATGVFALLVREAWPEGLEDDSAES